jgi:hypothetical protein
VGRTVGHSPSPSRDSNSQSTEDDYRVNIQDEYYNNSRTEGSQSPRYRRGAGGGNKQKERSGYSSKDDDDVAPSGIRNAAHAYAAQPAGLVDESHLHIEVPCSSRPCLVRTSCCACACAAASAVCLCCFPCLLQSAMTHTRTRAVLLLCRHVQTDGEPGVVCCQPHHAAPPAPRRSYVQLI